MKNKNVRLNKGFHSRKTGNLGEHIASKYIKSLGYRVLARNYQKTWGEIDIIAIKDNIIHFIEVKSVTYWSYKNFDIHRPEDNVHGLKTRHIRRMVETFLEEGKWGLGHEFQFHVICVYLNMLRRTAKVKMLKNLIL